MVLEAERLVQPGRTTITLVKNLNPLIMKQPEIDKLDYLMID
jgi:hypothetical protein